MPGLSETEAGIERPVAPLVAEHRRRKRAWLVALLVSLGCHVCPAQAGEGCDQFHDDSEMLVKLDRDPPLFAHLPRIVRVIIRRPTIRRLVIAQFADGDPALEYLTGDKT